MVNTKNIKNYRFAIFGKNTFTEYFIKQLNKFNFNKPIIIVSPDQEYYRDKKLLQKYNLYCNIDNLKKKGLVKVYKIKDINNKKIYKILDDNNINIGMSTSCRNIFKKKLISYFKGNLFNIHNSFLPNERGGAAYSWRILNDIKILGNTIHQIDEGVDTGKILLRIKYRVKNNKLFPLDAMLLEHKKCKILINNYLKLLINNKKNKLINQEHNKSYYFPRLETEINGLINWDWSTNDIEKFIRAFSYPYPGAYSFYLNKKVHILEAYIEKTSKKFHPFLNGKIFTVLKNKSIRMIAGGKSLIIKKISINNKIYIPGNILKVKNTFVSKYKDLLLAKATLPKVDKMNFNNVHKIKQ